MSRMLHALVLATATVLSAMSFAAPALADDPRLPTASQKTRPDGWRDRGRFDRDHRDRRGREWSRDRNRDRDNARQRRQFDRYKNGDIVIGGDNPPARIPGIGTYSGGVSAYRDRGNGNYFYIEGRGYDGGRDEGRAPSGNSSGPKIITPGGGSNGCQNDNGVCVMRPGN